MQSFAFYLDRTLPLPRLTEAMSSVLATSQSSIRAIEQEAFERNPWHWFTDDISVGLEVASIRGDFPQEVTVVSRAELDTPQTIGAFANALGATLLTDEFGVNPLDVSAWTMVFPTGEIETVYADSEEFGSEDPAIILLPAYRKDLDESHRRAVI